MSRRAWVIHIGFSLGLWLLAQQLLGACVALTALVAILVHEVGHWTVWRLAGEKTVIFASPYLGACIPVGDCDMDIFTPLGKGLLLLGGCLLSLVFAVGVHLAAFLLGEAAECKFLFLLGFFPLLLNLLNLLVVLPITDGGRWLLLVTCGAGKHRSRLIGGLGLIQGVVAFGVLDRVGCLIFGLLSLFMLPAIARQTEADAPEIDTSTRIILLAAWAGIVCGSILLLLADPIIRLCAQDLASGVAARCQGIIGSAARFAP